MNSAVKSDVRWGLTMFSRQKFMKAATSLILASAVTTAAVLLTIEDARASKKKSACPDLEKYFTEISNANQSWYQVSHLQIRDIHYSEKFETYSVEKLYSSKLLSKDERNIAYSKFKQTGCDSVTEVKPDGTEVPYKILDKTASRIVLYPVSFEKKKGEVDFDRTVTFRVKRISGYRTLEKTWNTVVSLSESCKGQDMVEAHPVEVKAFYSWKKPVQLRRVASENMLRILEKTQFGKADISRRKIASCE